MSGIGGYNLADPNDRIFAFDYMSTGRLDHLVLYRPGQGTIWILKMDQGEFLPVVAIGAPGAGLGGYNLADPADRMFAFDYDSTGKLDHLVLYRPGQGTIWILRNNAGTFSPVFAEGAPGNGIGGYNLADSADRMFAFDYDSTGKLDHLVLYRPGQGTIWILRNNAGTFSPVFAEGAPGNGIGGYNLADSADRIFAFDYDSTGKLDHLVLYRPGQGTIWILRNNAGTFSPVFSEGAPGNGIGYYDLGDPADRVFAFDYGGTGKFDHLVLYRPGQSTIWILRRIGAGYSAVYQSDLGIGGYDLADFADRIVPFIFQSVMRHRGDLTAVQDLVLYRPGQGTVWVLINESGTFSPVYPYDWFLLQTSADRSWKLTVCRNAEDGLDAFGISCDDRIWRARQTTLGGAWTPGWTEVYSAGDRLRTLEVVRNLDGRLQVFGISADSRIWHTWATAPGGAWNGNWIELYTAADSLMSLRAICNSDGRLEVFGIAPDESIWHTWQTAAGGAWNGAWVDLYGAGDRLRCVVPGINADGRLEIFGVSSDGRVWRTWQTAASGAWNGAWIEMYSVADQLRFLDVIANRDGRLEVFGISPDERIWHTWQTPGGAWNGSWTELYSPADRLWKLRAAQNGDGRLEVIGQSSDDAVWHTWQTTPGGAWNGAWELLYNYGDRIRSLDVGRDRHDRIEVVGITPDERIRRTRQFWPGRWAGEDTTPLPAPPLTPAVQYADVNGYLFDETSEWWRSVCEAFPCFAALQWPDYDSTIVEDTIDGQAVVIQLWKGWCQKFAGLAEFPGGIGAEVGIYRRIAGRPVPASLPFLPPALSASLITWMAAIGGRNLWWPFPELHTTIEFQLVNPITNETFFCAGPESTYWMCKWMVDASYTPYKQAQGVGRTPPMAVQYFLDYRINGKTYPRW